MEPGRLVSRLTVRPELLAPNGYLHAAAIIALADTTCGYGTFSDLPAGANNLTTIELKSKLVDVRGIGRWTAEMFLFFHPLRPNVWPVDDLGLLKAVGLHYRAGERISASEVRKIGQAWQPCAPWPPGTCGAAWIRWRWNIRKKSLRFARSRVKFHRRFFRLPQNGKPHKTCY